MYWRTIGGSRAVVLNCSVVIWSTPKLATEPTVSKFPSLLNYATAVGMRFVCVQARAPSRYIRVFEYSNEIPHWQVMLMGWTDLTLLGGSATYCNPTRRRPSNC